jgi:hypothetical protein
MPETDLVVGLLSHNDARTAHAVAAAVREGCARLGVATTVIWADSGSTDDTVPCMRAAMQGLAMTEVEARTSTTDLLEGPYHGIPGKARALHAVLGAAAAAGSRACLVLDAGAAVAPHWIEGLAAPVLTEGADFVSPYFHRAPHEGALTRGIVYPFVRALYGVRLRQPAAAEFACSPRLLAHVLDEDLWEVEGSQTAIDVWLTTSALASESRLVEAMLGVRPPAPPGEEAPDLTTTIRQVLGALFVDMDGRVDRWTRVRGSVAVPVYRAAPAEPSPARGADLDQLLRSFRLGYRELRDVWTWALPPKVIVDLGKLAEAAPASFRLEDELWARIVYDFALAHRLRVLPRDHLLGSMVPLYLGWLASFLLSIGSGDEAAVDARVEDVGAAFEGQKSYLIARWRWPERIRS